MKIVPSLHISIAARRQVSQLYRSVVCVVAIALVVLTPATANAITSEQQRAFNLGAGYFNTEDDVCAAPTSTSPGGGGSTGGSKTNPGIWSSGLTPPYSFEDYVVNVLKDIAREKGVDQSKTLTEEHIIALVAFGWGEGGNLTNQWLYNVWNTGYAASDIQPVPTHHSNGTQGFATFDQGVEATTRVMVGGYGTSGYQSRLGDILVDPNSTAEQFMNTLTYYNKYPGNLAWAAASDPKAGGNPTTYLAERLRLVSQTRRSYVSEASVTLGPPGFNAQKGLRVPASSLHYIPKGAVTGGGGNVTGSDQTVSTCATLTSASGTAADRIVQIALQLAWPEPFGSAPSSEKPPQGYRTSSLTPTNAYKAACKQYNNSGCSASYGGADCGAFVATVMHMSHVDDHYPGLGTGTMLDYVNSHKNLYSIKFNPPASDLQKGDILILGGNGGAGHTWIFTGPQGKYSSASASLGSRMPNLGNTSLQDSRGPYTRARYIGPTSGGTITL